MTENVKCGCCGHDILLHSKITLISCLSNLTGYASVFQEKENKR